MAESSDPKELLNQLKQIAIVCQRLGIDLGKVSAMGQNIGGKGTTGNSPLSTQNPDHAPSHEGGGTGYTNLVGAILGSTTSARLATHGMFHGRMVEYAKNTWMPSIRGDINVMKRFKKLTKGENIDDWEHRDLLEFLEEEASRSWFIRQRRGMWRTGTRYGSVSPTGPFSNIRRDRPAYSMLKPSLIDRIGGRIGKNLLTLHAVQQSYSFFSEPLELSRGETYVMRATERVASIAEMAANLTAANALMQAGSQIRRGFGALTSRTLAGKSVALKAGVGALRAAKFAGPQIGIAVAAEVASAGISEAMDRYKFNEGFKVHMAAVHQGFMGDMHRGPDYIHGYRYPKIPIPLPAEAIDAMQAGLEKDRREWYIDNYGRKQQRTMVQRSLFGAEEKLGALSWLVPPLKIWNWLGGSRDKEKMSEYKIKRAQAANEDAMKKAEILDWEGAKFRLKEARELYPEKAADSMPFFWREPDKFLKTLEASRISARNWARSQQPRGGLRVGD